jgi:hypothetical protein
MSSSRPNIQIGMPLVVVPSISSYDAIVQIPASCQQKVRVPASYIGSHKKRLQPKTSNSISSIIQVYIDKVKGTTKVVLIYGCDHDGKSNNHQLRVVERNQLLKPLIPLAKFGDLNHFYVPVHLNSQRSVINFMTLYYMHTEGLKKSDATINALKFTFIFFEPYMRRPWSDYSEIMKLL